MGRLKRPLNTPFESQALSKEDLQELKLNQNVSKFRPHRTILVTIVYYHTYYFKYIQSPENSNLLTRYIFYTQPVLVRKTTKCYILLYLWTPLAYTRAPLLLLPQVATPQCGPYNNPPPQPP